MARRHWFGSGGGGGREKTHTMRNVPLPDGTPKRQLGQGRRKEGGDRERECRSKQRGLTGFLPILWSLSQYYYSKVVSLDRGESATRRDAREEEEGPREREGMCKKRR